MRATMALPWTLAACLVTSVSCHAGQSSAERTMPFEGGGTLKLAVASDGTALRITETYPADLPSHLDRKSCRGLLLLDLDTDNNAATGGTSSQGRGGYEYEETLWGCGPEYTESSSAPAATAFFTTFGTKRFTAKDDHLEPVHDYSWQSPVLPLQGNVATISVPYSELALKSGQVVRISPGPFEDVVLTLK